MVFHLSCSDFGCDRLVLEHIMKPYINQSVLKTCFVNEIIAFYDITGATYQKRMLGMREYIHAGFKYFPLQIALLNLISYPIIWLKVKVIRAFQHTFWFKAYRKWKFNKQLAQYSHES